MKKCKYCNKKNIEDDFCSDDCKNKGERYFNYWKKYKYFFGLIIAISIFVIIMQVALYPEYIIVSKILTLVLGLTFFIFPFGNAIAFNWNKKYCIYCSYDFNNINNIRYLFLLYSILNGHYYKTLLITLQTIISLGIFFFITCILPIVLIVYSIKKSKKHDMDYFANMLIFATLNNF